MSVTALLEDDLDVARGDMLCAADAPAQVARDLRADVCWLDEAAARPGAPLPGQAHDPHDARGADADRAPRRRRQPAHRARPRHARAQRHRPDHAAHRRAAGGRPLRRQPPDRQLHPDRRGDQRHRRRRHGRRGDRETAATRSPNVVWERGSATRADRWAALGQQGATIWLTGLPASGKSAIAAALEARLVGGGRGAYLIDGDNLRHGLSGDLGFDAGSRAENVRRAGEAARMMADAGLVVIVALVSPYAEHRDRVRRRHAEDDLPFVEVFVDTPLEVCEAARPQGPVPAGARRHAARPHGRRRPVRAARRARPRARRHAAAAGGRRAARGAPRGPRAAVISYLVCATPRSGSTLLCKTLAETGVAGDPEEFFEAVPETGVPRRPLDYLRGLDDAEALALVEDAPPHPAPPYSDLRGVGELRASTWSACARGARRRTACSGRRSCGRTSRTSPGSSTRTTSPRSSTPSSTARGWSGCGAPTRSARPCRCGARCRRSRGAPRTSPTPASRSTRSPPCGTSSSC